MNPEDIKISAEITPQIIYVGKEQTPVIIIDDFMVNKSLISDHAIHVAEFNHDDSSYYPGTRHPLPKPYVIRVLNAVYQLIYQVYQIPKHLQLTPKNYCFSLINHQPDELKMLQRMPHFDALSPNYFAILHYLNPAPHGNTGLFKHIPTQWERVNSERSEGYFASAKAHIAQHGEPEAGYCVASNSHYELYHEIEYRENRLVIYPGNLLHSILIEDDKDIDPSPKTGRLTANMFVEYQTQ